MPTVIIYWSPTRTPQQKAEVAREITETLVEKGSARREDVLIIFQGIQAGDAVRGGQITESDASSVRSDGDDANGAVSNSRRSAEAD